MTLRTKLVLSFTGLLLVVIAAVGLVATRSVEGILVGQIDATLEGFARRSPDGLRPFDDRQPPPIDDLATDPDTLLRPFAEMSIAADGTVTLARPSGFTDTPDPLPSAPRLTGAQGHLTVPSTDGSLEYRAIAETTSDGSTYVHAFPLKQVGDATSALLRLVAMAGGGVLVAGGLATWWTVRRAMQPVDEMIDTAESIAHGDLSRRVPRLQPNTELGRLGNSLNAMLSHLQHAVETERASNQRMRRFIADASHELRTPLTAVAGYAELKRKGGLADRESEDQAWTRIEREGTRMRALVEDLLTLTRLGEGGQLEVGAVDLAETVRDAVSDHRVIDPTRPVDLGGADTVWVEGDADRLHQVVTNLLANARVHTPPGTKVEVEVVQTPEGMAKLTVCDDGPGIPAEAVDRVFERFFRVDDSRSRRSGGSGLGLAIVHEIVRAHGGTTAADNLTEGGARFTIELPLSTEST